MPALFVFTQAGGMRRVSTPETLAVPPHQVTLSSAAFVSCRRATKCKFVTGTILGGRPLFMRLCKIRKNASLCHVIQALITKEIIVYAHYARDILEYLL